MLDHQNDNFFLILLALYTTSCRVLTYVIFLIAVQKELLL